LGPPGDVGDLGGAYVSVVSGALGGSWICCEFGLAGKDGEGPSSSSDPSGVNCGGSARAAGADILRCWLRILATAAAGL
jgi:hypothetical protein